jgi:hypothetical protein
MGKKIENKQINKKNERINYDLLFIYYLFLFSYYLIIKLFRLSDKFRSSLQTIISLS